MVVLKKYSGATLVENLVASVLLVLLYLLVGALLQYFFFKYSNPDSQNLQATFEKHYYLYSYGKKTLPLQEELSPWVLNFDLETVEGQTYFAMNGKHLITNEIVVKQYVLQREP